jgi:hypothetical protein
VPYKNPYIDPVIIILNAASIQKRPALKPGNADQRGVSQTVYAYNIKNLAF